MKKAKSYIWISFTAIICFEFLISPAMAATDLIDVMALEDLYRTLGYPPQLIGWSLDGGDPCLESWTGISCNGTSVRLINLAGLDLGATLGWQLNLPNPWKLDLSFNHMQGQIPGSLPLHIRYIDLSSNKFSMNIPYSLAFMKHLHHLNLSHNSLSGPISNLFADLQSLKQMDLSDNNFIGDLPSSFGNLTNLTALYLQNNHFTGSVAFLENLQLTDLNIQNNNFSGQLPKQFQRVPNLWIWGNSFQFAADFPPWDFPQNNIPTDQNINSPPTNELNAIESHPRFGDGRNRQKRFSPVGIAFGVVGVAVVATCAAILFAVQIKRARALSVKDLKGGNNSLPITATVDLSFAPEELPQISTCTSPPVLLVRRLPSVRHGTSGDLNGISSSSRRLRKPLSAKCYCTLVTLILLFGMSVSSSAAMKTEGNLTNPTTTMLFSAERNGFQPPDHDMNSPPRNQRRRLMAIKPEETRPKETKNSNVWSLILSVLSITASFGVIWHFMVRREREWQLMFRRQRLREWPDEMMKISLDYERCNGDAGVILLSTGFYRDYVTLIRFCCELIYGRLVGRIIGFDYLAERGLAIRPNILNLLMPEGERGLDITWRMIGHDPGVPHPLTPQTDWEYFLENVGVIRVRPTGDTFQIVEVPWLRPVNFQFV